MLSYCVNGPLGINQQFIKTERNNAFKIGYLRPCSFVYSLRQTAEAFPRGHQPIITCKRSNVFTHVCHSVHGMGSLYDATSCLAAWCHVPSRGFCLSFHVPSGGISVRGGSLSERFLSRGSLSEGPLSRGLCPEGLSSGVSLQGGLYQRVLPDTDPHRVKSKWYASYRNTFLLLKKNCQKLQGTMLRRMSLFPLDPPLDSVIF